MFAVGNPDAAPAPPAGAKTPAQVQQAYGFSGIMFGAIHGDGSGQTIAIVDAQDDPNIQADLNTFDAQFGLPATTVTRVDQNGGTSYPATDSSGGWEMEESLDVEWAHAMAPGAQILLVEANSAYESDLLTAVDYASAHANVVSMSWGGGEYFGENSSGNDGHFVRPGVAFVASSGDSGAPVSWPASSPDVLAVGGTALYLGANNAWSSETGWSGSGGGPSAYEAQPSYQLGVVTQTAMRANPDVAYDASPSTGFAVADTFPYNGSNLGWVQVGGTSAGAPQWAALLAIADQGRALGVLPALNSSSPQEVASVLYQNAATGDFHDITTGTSTGSPNYSAGPGYDFVTGLGSPVANLVVQSLVGTSTTPAPSDQLVISAPASATAGTPFSITITAVGTGGTTDTSYVGAVAFSSSDIQAGLPASYPFTTADAGSHTFTVTLKTAGSQSITATDVAAPSVTGTVSGIAVSPAPASQFILAGLPASTTVGAAQTFTVTAKDLYGNVATGYAGTVHFTSSDTQAALPSDYPFTAADGGVHAFSVTFGTAGSQSITVADSAAGLSATQSGISVAPAAPTNLAANAASNTQIALTWTGSAGAASYLIERSPNGSSGWTQIASTPAGTASFTDSGLAAGTTYSYRVRATGGGVNSAYSNTTSATTMGAAAVDTLWSNSYTPPENAYSWGSYELGVKFRTDVSGTVTGVRFYKQTWMGGFTHVGHLWTSTGVLLASARFTNETGYGWQQVSFSSPVQLSPNTVYIVSFSSGGGYFGISTGFFSGSGVDSGPLHALANGVSGGDGVYHYGNGSFPSVGGNGMNFWADVVFTPSASSATIVSQGLGLTAGGGHAGASSYVVTLGPGASQAGSSSASAAAQETRTASRSPAPASWSYRSAVAQSLAPASARPRGFLSF
jgi:hypothetical protein